MGDATPTLQTTFTLTTDDLDDAKRYGEQIEERTSKISGNAVAIGLLVLLCLAIGITVFVASRREIEPARLLQFLLLTLTITLLFGFAGWIRQKQNKSYHRQSSEFSHHARRFCRREVTVKSGKTASSFMDGKTSPKLWTPTNTSS